MPTPYKYLGVAAIFAATSVFAQPVIDTALFPKPRQVLMLDVNGNGQLDRLSITPLNSTFDVLTYDNGPPPDFWDESAFIVPINLTDSDSLVAGQNGTFTLNWGCFACGRYHSHEALTLRLQEKKIHVIGYDYHYADRFYAAVMSCSVNFLTGDAIVTADDVETITLTTAERALPLSEYAFETTPEACKALDQFDDAFLKKHFDH
ncbi:MAG: hypothetical protein ACPGVK_07015 [Halocynthiibacter sp.]